MFDSMNPPTVPQGLAPSPIPTLITVSQAKGSDGSSWVVLTFNTPQGVNVYFLEGDAAIKVAGELRHNGKAARSGLVLPPTLGLVPDAEDDVEPAAA